MLCPKVTTWLPCCIGPHADSQFAGPATRQVEETHKATSHAFPLVQYLIDPYEHTILTCSHCVPYGAIPCLYAVHCCPGSRRFQPNGDGQLGSVGDVVLSGAATGWIDGLTVVVVVIVGFLISGFGSAAGFISGCCSRQGHDGHALPVQSARDHVCNGQFDAQLSSVNDSSPSNVPSVQVLSSEAHVWSHVLNLKNSLEVPFAKINPSSSQFWASCNVHVFTGRGSCSADRDQLLQIVDLLTHHQLAIDPVSDANDKNTCPCSIVSHRGVVQFSPSAESVSVTDAGALLDKLRSAKNSGKILFICAYMRLKILSSAVIIIKRSVLIAIVK